MDDGKNKLTTLVNVTSRNVHCYFILPIYMFCFFLLVLKLVINSYYFNKIKYFAVT